MKQVVRLVPVVVAMLGCASAGRPEAEEMGSVELALETDGVKLDSVTFAVSGPEYNRTTVVDVATSTRVSSLFSGLPPGKFYVVLSAMGADDPALKCTGESAFQIFAGGTTQVSVDLLCKRDHATGSVAIDGSVYRCPLIESISAAPSEAVLGSVITLSASADGADANLTYEWTASRGTLSGADTPELQLTCTTPGPVRVKLRVVRADGACDDTARADVYCTSVEPPPEADDPSTPGDDRAGYIACHEQTCAPGSVCCPGEVGCAADPSDCNQGSEIGYMACDGPEDCPPTEECAVGRYWAFCGTPSFYGVRCHRDADCVSTPDSPNPCQPTGYCDGPFE